VQTFDDASIVTWFRFLVKQLRTDISVHKPAYLWHEMGFFTRCTSLDKTTILCFDVPDVLRTRLQKALSWPSWRQEDFNCFLLLAILTDEIGNLYDDSVWAIRDVVRAAEKVSAIINP
jgi:hypothetical protein